MQNSYEAQQSVYSTRAVTGGTGVIGLKQQTKSNIRMYTVFSHKWLGKEFNDHKTVTVSSMYTEFRTNNNNIIKQ